MKLSDKEILSELYSLKDCSPEEYPEEAVMIYKEGYSRAIDEVYVRFMNILCSCETCGTTCGFCEYGDCELCEDEDCPNLEYCDMCGKEIEEEYKVDFPNDGYVCFCSKRCARDKIKDRIDDFIYMEGEE